MAYRPLSIKSASDFALDVSNFLPLEDELFGTSRKVCSEFVYEATKFGIYCMGRENLGVDRWEWFIPEHRAVIPVGSVHVSKTTKQQARKAGWTFELSTDVQEVIAACALADRGEEELEEDEESIEWLDEEAQASYIELALEGKCYAVRVLNPSGQLAGGLFGLMLPTYVTVESMVSIESGASKAAIHKLDDFCIQEGLKFIDCQEYSDHLATLGAVKTGCQDFYSAITRPL